MSIWSFVQSRRNNPHRLGPFRNRAHDGPVFRHCLKKLAIFGTEHVIAVGDKFLALPLAFGRFIDRDRAVIPSPKFDEDDAARAQEFHLPSAWPLEKVEVDTRHA